MQTIENPKISTMSLSPLFPSPVLSQRLLPPHHPGQASYIWEVSTADGCFIVRTSRFNRPPDEDYWQGMFRLFEANSAMVHRLRLTNAWLHPRVPWRIPAVLHTASLGEHKFVVVEHIKGQLLERFDDLAPAALLGFGRALAALHQQKVPTFGSPLALLNPRWGHPMSQFIPRLWATMAYIAQRYYAEDAEAAYWLTQAQEELLSAPPIRDASPVLMDMDPSQFLQENGHITGLVDTELYVAAPLQLELAGLEYLLSPASLAVFSQGYHDIAALPDLSPFRRPFRVFLRLLSFQGPIAWDQWMFHSVKFPG